MSGLLEKRVIFDDDGNPKEIRYYKDDKLEARLGIILDGEGNSIGLRELDPDLVSPDSWIDKVKSWFQKPKPRITINTVDFIGLINWINTIKVIKRIEKIDEISYIGKIEDAGGIVKLIQPIEIMGTDTTPTETTYSFLAVTKPSITHFCKYSGTDAVSKDVGTEVSDANYVSITTSDDARYELSGITCYKRFRFKITDLIENITELLFTWEGSVGVFGTIEVWNLSTSKWEVKGYAYTDEKTNTVSLKVSIDEYVDSNGYVFYKISALMNIKTDLATLKVTTYGGATRTTYIEVRQPTGTNLKVDASGSAIPITSATLSTEATLSALNTKVPSDPAKESGKLTEIDTVLDAINTKIPSDPSKESGKLTEIDTVLDAINTKIPSDPAKESGKLTEIDTVLDVIKGLIDAFDVVLDNILIKNTEIDAVLDTIYTRLGNVETSIDLIETYTNGLEALLTVPSSVGTVSNVDVDTSAEQLIVASTPCRAVLVISHIDNTGYIMVGGSGGQVGAFYGGMAVYMQIDNVNKVYVKASVNDQKCDAIYVN